MRLKWNEKNGNATLTATTDLSRVRDGDTHAMMHCPLCGQAAHTRTSHYITTTTKERYNQCTNINCGHTFITHETFTRSICVPRQIEPAPPHPGQNGQGMLQFG